MKKLSKHQLLQDLFSAIGIEVITDADRSAVGLPTRNERGLTDYEMAIVESRRIEAMLQPIPSVIMEKSPNHLQDQNNPVKP